MHIGNVDGAVAELKRAQEHAPDDAAIAKALSDCANVHKKEFTSLNVGAMFGGGGKKKT